MTRMPSFPGSAWEPAAAEALPRPSGSHAPRGNPRIDALRLRVPPATCARPRHRLDAKKRTSIERGEVYLSPLSAGALPHLSPLPPGEGPGVRGVAIGARVSAGERLLAMAARAAHQPPDGGTPAILRHPPTSHAGQHGSKELTQSVSTRVPTHRACELFRQASRSSATSLTPDPSPGGRGGKGQTLRGSVAGRRRP
jgi:hypothetical protein